MISRKWYYAARAAVEVAGSSARTHRGVASELSRLWVQTGRLHGDASAALRTLALARSEADYDDGAMLTAEGVARMLDVATQAVTHIEVALAADAAVPTVSDDDLTADQKRDLVAQLTREMDAASEALAFERAAELRDAIAQIEADLAA